MAQDAEKLAAQGERLRELKDLARGVTYRKISDALNVSERQVQRWFAGESEISGENLKALAEFLGTSPDYIEYGVIKRLRPDDPPDLLGRLSGDGYGEIKTQLDGIEGMLESLMERLVRADVIAAVDADTAPKPQPGRPARRKRAA